MGQQFVDARRPSFARGIVDDRRPVSAVAADEIVPFAVAGDRHADLFLGRHQRGPFGATVVQLVMPRRAVRLARGIVMPLDARGFDEDLVFGRSARHAEIPKALIVVAISGLHDIGLGIELRAHLAEIVAEQPADRAADGRIVDAVGGIGHHHAALRHPAIVVDMAGVDQRVRESRHQCRCADRALRRRGMEGQPQAAEAGEAADRQLLDARILDERDQGDLNRLETADREANRAEFEMRADMRHGRQKQPSRLRGGKAAKDVGQAQNAAVEAGAAALIERAVRQRPKRRMAPPQGDHIGLEATFHIGEQHILAAIGEIAMRGRSFECEEFPSLVCIAGGGADAGKRPGR